MPAGAGPHGPWGITAGPDGALWFAEEDTGGGGQIGRITTAGVITEYPLPAGSGGLPEGIAAGGDGALWFTEWGNSAIGRISTAGAITEYPLPDALPRSLSVDTDGSLWFTEQDPLYGNAIGHITTSGAITEYPLPLPDVVPQGISAGGGNVWFIEFDTLTGSDTIDRLNTGSIYR